MKRRRGRILLAVTGWRPDNWLREFRANAPEREVVTEPDGEDDASIRYAVVWKQQSGILSRLPNLEAIFSVGAGVDHVFHDRALPNLPVVRIVADDLTMRMGEYVVWQVLDHFRQGATYRAQQAARIWKSLPQMAAGDITVGIMGLGVLGTDAAGKLAAIGFRIAGWSRTSKDEPGIACYHGEAGLDDFLAVTDILVVLLPLTGATKGILNTGLLAKLKKSTPLGGPVLINAGRGGLQVEADILKALDNGTLMAATLDVFGTEPLPRDSPFWSHPRVTVTPHDAAASDPHALVPQVLRQMDNLEKGAPVTGLVDRKAGY